MRWSILDVKKQQADDESCTCSEYEHELFLPDICRMKAVIQYESEVSVYYLSTRELAFKSDVTLEVDQEIPLAITYHRWKPEDIHETVTSEVRITAIGKSRGDIFLYKGQFKPESGKGMERFFDYLRQLPIGEPDAEESQDPSERRRFYRLDRVLPIMSRDIEGYRALTGNISLGGIMLLLDGGELSKGDIINLRLELDEYESKPLHFKSEVCWVVRDESDKLKVGVEFLDLDDEKKMRLTKYMDNVHKLFKWMNH